MTSAELVTLYEVDGKPFLQMNTWERHQQKRATKSKYPDPSDGVIATEINRKQMQSDDSKCPRNRESNTRNDIRDASNNARTQKNFSPPSLDEVAAYCKERQNGIDAQRFIDYYETRGWMLGKTKMKDWKAAVRTWERGSEEKNAGRGYGNPIKDEDMAAFMNDSEKLLKKLKGEN